MRKLAIVGSARSTKDKAPWDDDSFDIWHFNHGYQNIPRFTKWFDIHSEETIRLHPDYFQFLKENQKNVYLAAPIKELPKATLYPKKEIMAKYGSFFTNSASSQLALAIEQGYKEIHIYGIDLHNKSEYAYQKPSFMYLLGIAVGKAIKIVIPYGSKLFDKEYLYWLR